MPTRLEVLKALATLVFYSIGGAIADRIIQTGAGVSVWLIVVGIGTFAVGTLVLYDIFRPRKSEAPPTVQPLPSVVLPPSTVLPESAQGVTIGGRTYYQSLTINDAVPFAAFKIQRSASFMGVSLFSTVIDSEDTMTEMAERGVRLRFLLVNPTPENFKKLSQIITIKNPEKHWETVLTKLAEIKEKAKYPNLFEVKTYEFCPFHSMAVIDDELIHVGFYPYGRDTNSRPYAIVPKDKNKDVFEILADSFERAWKMAQPYPREDKSKGRTSDGSPVV